MKVKILKSIAGKGFHYGQGAVVELPQMLAQSLIKGKLAEQVEVEPKKPIPKIQRETSKTDIQDKNSTGNRANKPRRPKKGAKA